MFNLFSKKKQTSEDTKIDDDALAVISLLVEAANIDEVFEDKEKKIISTIIKKQFMIKNEDLINNTIDKVRQNLSDSGDLVSHTKKIKDTWSLQKSKEIN